jgi:hypothetical protein
MFPIVMDAVASVLGGSPLSGYSQVSVQVGTLKPFTPVPDSGLDASLGEGFTPLTPTSSYPLWQTTLVNVVIFSYEINPFIGPLFQLAHLAYAGSTGQTLAGQTVNESDLFFMGVFAAISIAGEPIKGVKFLSDHATLGANLFAMAAQMETQ